MQFVDNGPDIPDALLVAHEAGRVVFFCGAGISFRAGLPGFRDLVDDIYRLVGTTREANETAAYKREQYDAVLDLLERRLPGQRIAVRRVLPEALNPKLRRKGATETHSALLRLGRNREDAFRLVTTNYDRIFERVARRNKQSINIYAAPMLPIPKNSRWNGLVHLHGRLPKIADDSALRRLVLTSGDFGLAYLTERWAARFVTELFRNYVVCFIGYSINDPVLRYMMDALAADRMLGEVTPQAYALADCEPGQEAARTVEWEAKGVTPILYEVPSGSCEHSSLHRTLKVWAETYRDGVLGRERIVVDYALSRPSASTRQDDFVGRMLWALAHESGLPAKRFAEFNPVPTLEWLEVFSEDRYRHDDLERFGVPSHSKVDEELRFSMIRRPAPYSRAPWISLVAGGATTSTWDDVMSQLAHWLVRHLNNPDLVIWLARRGGQLHPHLAALIEHKLDHCARLEREGNTTELAAIRADAPNAIPQPVMHSLWRLLLTGRVKAPWNDFDLYRWRDRLKRDGLTASLRLELRELLAPKVTLKKPFRWRGADESTTIPSRLEQIVDWELVLASDAAHSWLRGLTEDEYWRNTLPMLLDDFQRLLHDTLDLLRELLGADDRSERSYLYLPSISPHWQNRGFHDWSALIELLRDAWLSTRDVDPELATRIAQEWFSLPYSTFKRLALFAASYPDCIATEQWTGWLLSDGHWWLWSVETQRETMRLLVLQHSHMSTEIRARLEDAVLAGPPLELFRDDIELGQRQSLVERAVWLRLAKLQEGGGKLDDVALQRFNELSAANTEWSLAGDESDEFPVWMSGTGDPDYEAKRHVNIAPRKRGELVIWLKQSQSPGPLVNEDTWRETCRSHFYRSFLALCDVTQEGVWLEERWREALQAWSEEGQALRSWRFGAPLVQTMPDEVLGNITHAVTWWIESASKSMDRHETTLFELCRRVLALPHQDESSTDRPVSRAINHPIGHVTQALLNVWFGRKPNDDETLSRDFESFFSHMCDTRVVQFRHGRVLLASHLIALFRVDRQWTEKNLLPLFDWTVNPVEARASWEGFLWSPRLYGPLMIAFKVQFLSTAYHYEELGEHHRQFAALLIYAALERVDSYSPEDWRSAIGALPRAGLEEAGRALAQALESAGEQAEEYWENRVQPLWKQIWPKSREMASGSISDSLVRLIIAARGKLPAALSAVRDWLRPIEHLHPLVHRLHDSGLASRFPEDVLHLLDAIIDAQPWPPPKLGQCLTSIRMAAPALEEDHRHQRLVEYSRRSGI